VIRHWFIGRQDMHEEQTVNKMTRRDVVAFSAFAPVLGGRSGAAGNAATTPREKIRRRYFPNVVLRTHHGKRVRFYDDLMKDRSVAINVMYAGCEGVCPRITSNLVDVQKLLGDRVGREFFMYSITLKPEQDTPRVLREYARAHGVGPGWTYLTGDPPDIELLRRSLGFTNPNPELDSDASQHIGNVRYGNEPLMLWAACPGMAAPAWIAKSISWVLRPADQSTGGCECEPSL
jgi:protein SCO1/2